MQVSTSTRHCLLVHIFQPTCITYQYQQQQLSNCKRQKTCSVQTIQGIEFIYLVNGCSKVFTESPTVNDWRISTTTEVFSHHESTCHILLPPGGPLIAVLDQKQLEMHVVALLYYTPAAAHHHQQQQEKDFITSPSMHLHWSLYTVHRIGQCLFYYLSLFIFRSHSGNVLRTGERESSHSPVGHLIFDGLSSLPLLLGR